MGADKDNGGDRGVGVEAEEVDPDAQSDRPCHLPSKAATGTIGAAGIVCRSRISADLNQLPDENPSLRHTSAGDQQKTQTNEYCGEIGEKPERGQSDQQPKVNCLDSVIHAEKV